MDSKILRDLCESYQNIYDGGFESWVDSLIEEGYDLSDYTCDEMYEAYIEEQNAFSGVKGPIHAFDTLMFGRETADSAARARGVLPKKTQPTGSKPPAKPTLTDAEFDKKYGTNDPKNNLARPENNKPRVIPSASRPAGTTPPAARPTAAIF